MATINEIAKELNVSRVRVYQIIAKLPEDLLDVSWFLRQLLREGIMNKSSLKRKEFLHANSLRQRIQTKHYQPI